MKITRGLEQGLRRAINDFARWQSAERILCRRLPEGLFVGQGRGGKSTPIDPGADLPVICCCEIYPVHQEGNMDHRLLEIIACPVCNGKLYYSQDKQELICKLDSLAFPLRDGIPVLLETEARALTVEESHSRVSWLLFLRVSPLRACRENHCRTLTANR